ncbi:MAG: F0F1 ATP synthase subunit epsilon [Actinomycetes bacterium]
MATQQVEVVAVDHEVWSGEAEAVNARTLEGEIGVLPGHTPLLGVLAPGHVVRVIEEGGNEIRIAAHGGFISVTDDGVQVLCEQADLSDDIDVSQARSDYDQHKGADDDDEEGRAAFLRARARLEAAGESVDDH